MADDPFDAHEEDLKDFENTLVDVCYDIIDASYDSGNAYVVTQPDVLDGKYAAPDDYVASVNAANPTPPPTEYDNDIFSPSVYRDDIANLAQVELPVFLDGADPSQFDAAITKLTDVSAILELATGDTGLERLIAMMDKWHGEAATNFELSILPKYSVSIAHQLVFIDELTATAMCLREVIERTRGDGLGLAQDLRRKVNVSGDGSVSLETVLWVAGSIFAGIAAFTVAGPVTAATVANIVALHLNTASSAIGQVQKLSGSETGERPISGETAYEFIPSCLEQIDNVLRAGVAEVDAVMSALKADLADGGADLLCISKPEVIDGGNFDLLDAENLSHDILIESIADLRFAGVVTLPTMANHFDKANLEVASLGHTFDAAIGQSTVVSGSRHILDEAIQALTDAFVDTRDYLYKAGVALTDIADAYFETEADNEAMMNTFAAQLDAYEENGAPFPAYTPDPAPTDPAPATPL